MCISISSHTGVEGSTKARSILSSIMKRRRIDKTVSEECDVIRMKVCKCCDGKKLSFLLLPACQRGQKFIRHAVIVEFGDVKGRTNASAPRGAEHSNVSK